jgi:hypothetical protein
MREAIGEGIGQIKLQNGKHFSEGYKFQIVHFIYFLPVSNSYHFKSDI